MNKFEEIQEIIKNFIYEKQQMKREIAKIERQRTQLAQERNEKKANAKTMKVVAEISELGKRITELGNQSQELQNKLDSRYLEVRAQVNTQINNLISQGISEIRKHEEIKKEKQVEVEKQEERSSKYQIQKQEFYNRFGRMPELSETAQKENQAKEEECKLNKAEIAKIDEIIKILQGELSELAKNQRQFKNGEWAQLVQIEEQPIEVEEENVEKVEEISEEPDVQEEIPKEIDIQPLEEAEEECDLEAILNLVEDIIEERENTSKAEEYFENEEEAVELPFIEEQVENNIQEEQEIEEIKVEDFQPIEELNVEEIEPIEEINVEEIEPIEEIHIEEKNLPEVEIEEIQLDELEPIEELQIEENEQPQELGIEEIIEKKVEEIKQEEQAKQNEEIIKEIAEEIKTQKVEEAKKEENNIEEINAIEEQEENAEEIITLEEQKENVEDKNKALAFGDKITLVNIIAKIEEGELVYKAEISNGKTIKIHPTNIQGQNLLLKDKENREEIKEILINYAIAEYRTLDKKAIKKIDPAVCEILTKFAKEYNYDAQNLIYNYAMSFSKGEDIEVDSIPQITYNVSYLDGTKLNKKEKEVLQKICKNAKKNEKVEIIGYNVGIKKIKYMFKRVFSINDTNALPEGKY